MQIFQSTLKRSIRLEGAGIHSGKKTVLTLHPAPVDHGIVFIRYDAQGRLYRFPALAAYSAPADLCTVLIAEKKPEGKAALKADNFMRVATIEHVMATLSAYSVDNVLAEISEREVPILDGSAAPYIKAIAEAGIEQQTAKRIYLHITKTVKIQAEKGGGFAEFCPLAKGEQAARYFDVEIAFAAKSIGRQHIAFVLSRDYFAENLARARTFGFLADAEKLRALGLAQGASPKNSVVIDEAGAVMNPQALIAPDGFVRHKALDAVGDTALLGRPFIGLFRSFKSGHKLNSAAVRALLADSGNYEKLELT